MEAVLQRPEAELDANPFDLLTALLPASEAPSLLAVMAAAGGAGGAAGQQGGGGAFSMPMAVALALIDEQLVQYAVEHPWGQELVAQ